MDINLEGLTLESLFSGLPSPAKVQKKAQHQPRPPEPAPTPVPISPWRAEAVVWLLHIQTCSHCGASFSSPGSDTPMVRFRHVKRPDQTWETSHHPTLLCPILPHEEKVLESTVEACFLCRGGSRKAFSTFEESSDGTVV